MLRMSFICLAYVSQSTTVKILDKTVLQEDWNKNTYIICCTALSSKLKFSWTFANTNHSLTSQQSVLQKADNCERKVGAYQLRDSPNVAFVCAINFTLHRGKYTCTVKNDGMNIHASKSMFLDIHGKNNKTFLCVKQQLLFMLVEEQVTFSMTMIFSASKTWVFQDRHMQPWDIKLLYDFP